MSNSATDLNTITNLKASAHLMLLDPGVFCVFHTPGSAGPDPSTGLPGVRLSPAPARGQFTGEVTLSGFNGEGWLAGNQDAALVRVTGGPAQILVTIYQSLESAQEAPKLQVCRLTPPERGAEAAQPGPAQTPIEVAAHIYGRGDVAGRLGEWMGERGSRRWIEGFGLQPAGEVPPSDLEYQAVLGRGWLSPWSEGGQFCGSRGMSLPILGLRVRLKGPSAETHTLAVSASFVDGTQIGPVRNGEACESPSLAALEAFQVTLEPRHSAVSSPKRAPAKPVPAPAPKAKAKPGTKPAAKAKR